MKALKPKELMANESGGPYAYRPRLGWYIVGPIMNGGSKGSISCHWVPVREASTSQIASHHFGIQDSIKGTMEEMFKMMYTNDFSETALLSSISMMSSVSRRPKTACFGERNCKERSLCSYFVDSR